MRDSSARAYGSIPYWEGDEPRPLALRLSADGDLGLLADGRFPSRGRHPVPFAEGDAREHLAWIVAAGGETDPQLRADELLAEFGSLGAVLAASPARLDRSVRDPGAAVLGISRFNAAAMHVLRSRIIARPLLSSMPEVIDYLRFNLSYITHERIRVLHLDARNRLMRDEQMGDSKATKALITVHSIVQRALELGSASLILVHNHPSGDPTPSSQDIDLTRRIVEDAIAHDIAVIDHLVIGAEQVFSFHHAGMLA